MKDADDAQVSLMFWFVDQKLIIWVNNYINLIVNIK